MARNNGFTSGGRQGPKVVRGGVSFDRMQQLLDDAKSVTAMETHGLGDTYNDAASAAAPAVSEKKELSADEQIIDRTFKGILKGNRGRTFLAEVPAIKKATVSVLSRFSHNRDLMRKAGDMCVEASKHVSLGKQEFLGLALRCYKPLHDDGLRSDDFLLNYTMSFIRTGKLDAARAILLDWGKNEPLEHSAKQFMMWGDYISQFSLNVKPEEISALNGLAIAAYQQALRIGLDSQALRDSASSKMTGIKRKGFTASSIESVQEFIKAQAADGQATPATPSVPVQGLDNNSLS